MIQVMKWRWLYYAISLAVLIPGLISLVMFGLKPSVDFTGGTLWEVKVTDGAQLTQEQVQQAASQFNQSDLLEISSVQASSQNHYLIRGETMTNDQKNQIASTLSQQVGPLTDIQFQTIGPLLGRELLMKTLVAAALAATLITIYVSRQFKQLKYGVCATLAMLHDTLVLLGSFSLLGKFAGVEVDVLFITALLTTLSFSVHDTIVVYDRIREFRRKHIKASLEELVNAAVIQTMGRSLSNSLTIIIMLLSLVLLGGETIKWFAVALLIGSITGTYSSTFTAAPLLLEWEKWAAKRAAKTPGLIKKS
jgi:preprotein translocase subunit SecF